MNCIICKKEIEKNIADNGLCQECVDKILEDVNINKEFLKKVMKQDKDKGVNYIKQFALNEYNDLFEIEKNIKEGYAYCQYLLEFINQYNKKVDKLKSVENSYVQSKLKETDYMTSDGNCQSGGIAFENFCKELLEQIGFINVVTTKINNDRGIDLFAEKNGEKYAIQCKCSHGTVRKTSGARMLHW